MLVRSATRKTWGSSLGTARYPSWPGSRLGDKEAGGVPSPKISAGVGKPRTARRSLADHLRPGAAGVLGGGLGAGPGVGVSLQLLAADQDLARRLALLA